MQQLWFPIDNFIVIIIMLFSNFKQRDELICQMKVTKVNRKLWGRYCSDIESQVRSHLTLYVQLATEVYIGLRFYVILTHWGRDEIDAISQTTFWKCIFLNENVLISIKISLKFIPMGPINNIPTLVHIMAWRRPGDKPLSEPMVVRFPTHICVTRPQWVNILKRIARRKQRTLCIF